MHRGVRHQGRVTVKEFCDRTYQIEEERRETLRPHELGDLRLYRRVVIREGKVTSLDEYFLKIIGVPWFGYYKQIPRLPNSRKAKPATPPEKQESLF